MDTKAGSAIRLHKGEPVTGKKSSSVVTSSPSSLLSHRLPPPCCHIVSLLPVWGPRSHHLVTLSSPIPQPWLLLPAPLSTWLSDGHPKMTRLSSASVGPHDSSA